MKVAVVTDDNRTISPHFGRAQYFLVYEIQDGKVMSKETREKSSHNHHDMVELHSGSDVEKPSSEQKQHHQESCFGSFSP